MTNPDLVEGLKWYLVFLGSTTLHEAAHAWSALKLGDDTAARGGQVSLDPTPHIRRAPWGMVIVPLLSWLLGGRLIGWASAPYDPVWAQQNPSRAALMALAGPASNLLLVLLGTLLLHVGLEWHFFLPGSSWSSAHLVTAQKDGLPEFAATMLSITVSLNLLLACFNLLPLPPLDGASLPLLFLPRHLINRYFELLHHPAVSGIGLLLAWQFFGQFFDPIRAAALKLLGLGF